MTDQEYAEDSQRMIIEIMLYEFKIDDIKGIRKFSEQAYLDSLKDFNVGREVLKRGYLKMFFNGGPAGINKRIRKSMVNLMIEISEKYPQIKGPGFDEHLRLQTTKLIAS